MHEVLVLVASEFVTVFPSGFFVGGVVVWFVLL